MPKGACCLKNQTTLTVPEESDSESENVPPTVTSTPVKSKTTAATLKTTPGNSRNKCQVAFVEQCHDCCVYVICYLDSVFKKHLTVYAECTLL